MEHWKSRYSSGGVCDFKQNYDFYFKWLLNKVCSCFVINGLPETINQTYLKSELILSGMNCITDFPGGLYSCAGMLGGQPDEYYIPRMYTIANPVLGSKVVVRGVNGVVIFNTAVDKLYCETCGGGLYQLINQTATLLADNIVSINSNQINSRVATFFTADSDAQALAGEVILKKMYAGRPYQILRSDLVEKIGVNPVATASTSSNITELVELNNYIISNFMQSIGIKSNNIMKRQRMITDEINSQNDYLEFSVLEMLASWQAGFDEVNKMYGTDIHVTLSPAVSEILVDDVPRGTEEPAAMPEAEPEQTEPEQTEPEQTESEKVAEKIENDNEIISILEEAAEGVKENDELHGREEGRDMGEDGDSLGAVGT